MASGRGESRPCCEHSQLPGTLARTLVKVAADPPKEHFAHAAGHQGYVPSWTPVGSGSRDAGCHMFVAPHYGLRQRIVRKFLGQSGAAPANSGVDSSDGAKKGQ